MKVLIFGAGASKGSQIGMTDTLRSAPLVDELFHENYGVWAEQVGLFVQDLRRFKESCVHEGVESWLTREWASVERLRQERTKHARRTEFGRLSLYIWRLFLEVSKAPGTDRGLYQVMARKLVTKDELVGLISFNYDLLLDQAVEYAFGADLSSFDGYLNFGFVKPHGSVNWLLLMRDSDPPTAIVVQEGIRELHPRFEIASSMMFNGPPIPMQNLRVISPTHGDLTDPMRILMRFGYQHFYPLVFLPLTAKAYSSVEGFLEKMRERGNDLLASADEIYLIGYRAKDDLIREMLQSVDHKARLHVVGKQDAGEISARVLEWNSHLEKGTISEDGFEQFVSNF